MQSPPSHDGAQSLDHETYEKSDTHGQRKEAKEVLVTRGDSGEEDGA